MYAGSTRWSSARAVVGGHCPASGTDSDTAGASPATGAETSTPLRSQMTQYNLPGSPPKSSSHDAAWRACEDAVQLEAMPQKSG
jgi:hypothetical protein